MKVGLSGLRPFKIMGWLIRSLLAINLLRIDGKCANKLGLHNLLCDDLKLVIKLGVRCGDDSPLRSIILQINRKIYECLRSAQCL